MKINHLLAISIFLTVTFLSLIECAKDFRGRRTQNRFLRRLNDEDSDDPAIDSSEKPYDETPRWISDKSDEILIDGNKALCLTNNVGGKFFAVWKHGKGENSGDHYWEITLEKIDQYNEVAVGLTNDERFNKNGKTVGLLYGGNLGNGQETLVEEYGPRFKTGDKIGILASYTKQQKLKVYFYLNKRSLGLAFDVDRSVLLNARPMIQFGSSAMASIKKEKIPSSRQKSKAEDPKDIGGTWKIIPKSVKFNGTQFNIDNIKNGKVPLVTLNVIPRSNDDYEQEYTSLMRVHNEIRFRTDKFKSSWKTYPGISATQNVPDFRLKTLENNLLALTKVGTLSLNNYKLIFKKEKTSSEVSFERYDPNPQPITKNPFSSQEDPTECYCPCSQ